MYVLLSFLLLCMVHEVVNQKDHELCKHTTCSECITDPVKCVWCSVDILDLDQRCKPASSNNVGWCTTGEIQDANNKIDIIDDRNFTSDEENVVQIKPQRIKITLRVGEPATFKFQYKAAKDFPVDLYFLFDASTTMKQVQKETILKSQEIYNVLKGLTNKVFLGLGTFIDKNVIPFNRNLHSKCYSFKHKLNLTDDVDRFKTKLESVKLHSNFDLPESGLDGLAQILACKESVLWRNQSRKLIILITDDNFHSAGDGKWSGVVKPYDGGCYLSSEGLYYNEKQMDYPSIGIISKLTADRQFTIIFAKVLKVQESKKHKKDPYEIIKGAIPGAHYSTYETETISNTLKNIYQNITQNINLDVNMASEDEKYFGIKFNPDCSKNNEDCTIVIDEEKTIEGTITLLEYYGKDHITIDVVQKGLQEHLLLDIDIISSCKCENEHETELNSPDCSFAGDRQCGICSCNLGRSGPACECDERNYTSVTAATCTKDGVLCSQHGDCYCGICSCHTGFNGHHCEFRDDSCKRNSYGAVCSGHGKCRNGQCRCNSDWEGEVCGCLKSNIECTDTNGIECNNRGHCYCGRCKCNKLPKWDVREYIDEYCSQGQCEDCHQRQCRALIDCYSCHGSGDCSEECGDQIAVADVTADNNGNWSVCTNIRVSFGCYSDFGYIYNDKTHEITLYVYSEPTCIESYYIYGGVSLGALILVGLSCLLAWRLGIEARDSAEFERFLEHAREENEELLNECYKPPTQTIQNPMFGKLSFRKRSFH